MANILQLYLSIGQSRSDIAEFKVRKSFLVFLATFMSCGGIIWGSISLYYDLVWQSLIPYGYVLISLFNLTLFAVLKHYNFARTVQLFISLLLPFLFQWSLGGFFSSGLIMLWALLAVMSAPALGGIRFSSIWMVLYLIGGIISYQYDEIFLAEKPAILSDHSLLFLTLNTLVISTIVFGLVIFYVGRSKSAQAEVQTINDKLRKATVLVKRKNLELESAQKELHDSNQKLEEAKANLERINEKQQQINQKLLQEKGYFGQPKDPDAD